MEKNSYMIAQKIGRTLAPMISFTVVHHPDHIKVMMNGGRVWVKVFNDLSMVASGPETLLKAQNLVM